MMIEGEAPHHPPGEGDSSLPVQVIIPLQKVRIVPEIDTSGQKQLGDNIDSPEVMGEIETILNDPKHSEHKRLSSIWHTLEEQAPTGKKAARYIVTFGAIIITFGALGYEVLGRHGKDAKIIVDLFKSHRRKKP